MNLRSSAAIIHLSVLVYHYERVSRGSYIFLASINSLRICIIYVTHIRARVAPAVSRLTTLDYEIVRESPRSRENLIINSKEIRLFCSYFLLSFSLSLCPSFSLPLSLSIVLSLYLSLSLLFSFSLFFPLLSTLFHSQTRLFILSSLYIRIFSTCCLYLAQRGMTF